MQEQNKQVKSEQGVLVKNDYSQKKVKRKVNKTIDCDYLMYNSPEDEDYLRNVVKDNYSNTVQNSSEY